MIDEELKKELEAEISRVAERYPEVSFAKLSRIAVHFAKWQAEQDNYDTIFHKGMMYYRKQMMEDAVEGRIGQVAFHNAVYLQELKWTNFLDGFKKGDKVRIIIVKED